MLGRDVRTPHLVSYSRWHCIGSKAARPTNPRIQVTANGHALHSPIGELSVHCPAMQRLIHINPIIRVTGQMGTYCIGQLGKRLVRCAAMHSLIHKNPISGVTANGHVLHSPIVERPLRCAAMQSLIHINLISQVTSNGHILHWPIVELLLPCNHSVQACPY